MRLKRCFDIALSAFILFALSPVFLVAALAVWWDSGFPVLFRQQRVGRQFEPFFILKFRTMDRLSSGPLITVGGDRRVTNMGRFLRLTKIDEFPQFWNVLRGEMSIVGPRPEVPEYVELFKERYARILTVKPGITDLASIYFRHEEKMLALSLDPLCEYRDRILPIKLDLADRYIQQQKLSVDIAIIMRTALVMLWPARFNKSDDLRT